MATLDLLRARRFGLLSWTAALSVAPAFRGGTQPATARVSVDSAGNQANGDSFGGSMSANGRFVAFHSLATNLVPGDSNGEGDVFVRDRRTGMTERVSVDSEGRQANGASGGGTLSGNSRFVAFVSSATNLVPGDTNGFPDVFVHDRRSGVTRRVSVDSDGGQANGDSAGRISRNGRFVAFTSVATNLVPGDTNGFPDVFVHDTRRGVTTRVSVDSTGAQANGTSLGSSISADGRFVAFWSDAADLVPDDTNGAPDFFLHDRRTGTTSRVSVSSSGGQARSISAPGGISEVSANGRFVAFESGATDLVPDDTNGVPDAFVHDRTTGITTRVSVDSSGGQANGATLDVSISGSGRFVAFMCGATNLVPGDTNGLSDVFVHDTRTGITTRVSVDSTGGQANVGASFPEISANGREVAFSAASTNLVPGDTNDSWDVFVRRW